MNMAREAIETFLNLSDADTKRCLMRTIGALTGLYDVALTPRRATRSNAANRYYWSCVVRTFADFLRDQGEAITDEEAHRLLAVKFLRRSIVNKSTGEIIGQAVRSTTSLDTIEFGDYIERCIAWLADALLIIVPDPDVYHEKADPIRAEERAMAER